MPHIALVESNSTLAFTLGSWLTEAGHSHVVYAGAEAFTKAFRNGSHELVVIDWTLHDSLGSQVLRFVREQADWYIPVVLLTEPEREDEAIRGLTAGADDFIVKPVHRALWTARLGALARRALEDRRTLQVGPYRLDRSRRVISRDGRPVNLTDKEFQLAALLLANPGQVLAREFLLESVWGEDTDAATRTVDTHASRVRHKLGLTRRGELWLRPVYGRGYELVRTERGGAADCATDMHVPGSETLKQRAKVAEPLAVRWGQGL